MNLSKTKTNPFASPRDPLATARRLRQKGRYSDALLVLDEARLQAVMHDHKRAMGLVCLELSRVNLELRRVGLSKEYAQKSVDIFNDLGPSLERGWSTFQLAKVLFHSGHSPRVLAIYKKISSHFSGIRIPKRNRFRDVIKG